MNVTINEYNSKDELEWLDVHASVMVDSYAWWTVLHRKLKYDNEVIDLVAKIDNKIVGFITTEINSKVIDIVEGAFGFVWEFGVHRNYRGYNIGYMLIKETHKRMGERFDINKSIWYSQDENAQTYYENIGMREITRHWQFTVYPNSEAKSLFKKDNLNCWGIRGSCNIEEFHKISSRYTFSEDDTLKPRICVGYEYVHIAENV